MMKSLLTRLILLLVGIALPQGVRPGNAGQDEPIKLRTELVVLDAQVLRKKTALAVGNLAREDFVLYEDGVKQHITNFSVDKLPLSVIILFDVSGSVAARRSSAQRLLKGAYDALNLLKPEDEVALMQFAERASLIQPFTRDRNLIVNSMARMDGRYQYGTYVANGVLEAAKFMRSASSLDSRRVIITVTDDMTVAITDRLYTAPMTHAEGEALNELYETGSVLCAVVYESRDNPTPRAEEPYTTEARPREVSPNVGIPQVKPGVAKHFAEMTGGISIKTSEEDIPTRLAEMIERLRQRYTIGYTPSNTGRDGKFRKIKLTVTPDVDKREGGVAVITRKGYYAK